MSYHEDNPDRTDCAKIHEEKAQKKCDEQQEDVIDVDAVEEGFNEKPKGKRSYNIQINYCVDEDDVPRIKFTGEMDGRFEDNANPVLAAFTELSAGDNK